MFNKVSVLNRLRWLSVCILRTRFLNYFLHSCISYNSLTHLESLGWKLNEIHHINPENKIESRSGFLLLIFPQRTIFEFCMHCFFSSPPLSCIVPRCLEVRFLQASESREIFFFFSTFIENGRGPK